LAQYGKTKQKHTFTNLLTALNRVTHMGLLWREATMRPLWKENARVHLNGISYSISLTPDICDEYGTISPGWSRKTTCSVCFSLTSCFLPSYSRFGQVPKDNWKRLCTGQTPFLSPNQQCQTTEGNSGPYNKFAFELRFYILLHTIQVISETLFPANLLTGTEKTKSKPGERSTNTYNKRRLMQTTKFTTMQYNHAAGIQQYFNSK